jgi:hypothetical protein
MEVEGFVDWSSLVRVWVMTLNTYVERVMRWLVVCIVCYGARTLRCALRVVSITDIYYRYDIPRQASCALMCGFSGWWSQSLTNRDNIGEEFTASETHSAVKM